ncbi:hypothetical protein [Xanthomonas axonopodis]
MGNGGKIGHAANQQTKRSGDQNNNQADDEDGSRLAPGLPTEIRMQGGHISSQPLGERAGIGV